MTAVPTVLIEGNLGILEVAIFGLIPALEVTGPIGSLVACPSRPRALLATGVPLPLPDHTALCCSLSHGGWFAWCLATWLLGVLCPGHL